MTLEPASARRTPTTRISNSFDPDLPKFECDLILHDAEPVIRVGPLQRIHGASSENSEYQFVVDSRGITTSGASGTGGTIGNGSATAYVYVTGRAGISGHYACMSIKAAVNVLNPTDPTSVTTSNWATPNVTENTPMPAKGDEIVTFSITGASGAAGGNGFLVKGGAGGLGGSVSGTITLPAFWPSSPTTPIYFGTEIGQAGALGTSSAAGYAAGGPGGKDGGGGGAASAFCIMPLGATNAGTCAPSMPACPGVVAQPGGTQSIPTTGCVIAVAAGGGGGGQAILIFLNAGKGGSLRIAATAANGGDQRSPPITVEERAQ